MAATVHLEPPGISSKPNIPPSSRRQQDLLRRAAELRRQQQQVERELQELYRGLGDLPEAERAQMLEALEVAGPSAATATPAAAPPTQQQVTGGGR